MDAAQTSQVKRTIKVKDFLEDFRSGRSDEELADKYHLSSAGLEKFYSMLLERKILDAGELEVRGEQPDADLPEESIEESEEFGSLCPACLSPRETAAEPCSVCGYAAEEFVEQADEQELEPEDEEKIQDLDSRADLAFEDWLPHESDEEEFAASPAELETEPDKVPFEGSPDTDFYGDAIGHEGEEEFVRSPELERYYSEFDDSAEEVVPGMPFAYEDSYESTDPSANARCEACDKPVEAGVRKIYDRSGSYLALALGGICLALGFVGAGILNGFPGYSVARLVVIYFTGMSMLLGGFLLALALFMFYLAKEKVYHCYHCGRVYPRA
ncbi:MAG: hypothetical protein P8182_01875 [Deltaproteobacteria bacterium]